MRPATTFANQALAKRLALGGMIIAIILGGATFYFESERVDDTIVGLALDEARHLVQETPEIAAPTPIQKGCSESRQRSSTRSGTPPFA